MKKTIVWPLSLLVFVILGSLWYWYQSPSYAIRELKKAIETKDLALLYSRIDLPLLYDSAIDALSTKDLSGAQTPPSFMDKLGSQISAGSEKLAQGQSIDLIKHELELEFRRDRTIAVPLEKHLAPHSLRLFFHDISHIEWKDWVKVENDALFNTNIHLLKMKTSYPLTLRLKRSENNVWRLAGFEGLASLLSRYEADRRQKVTEHNQGIQRMLEEKLPFFGETRVQSENAGLSSTLYMDILFQNKMEETVKRIEGLIKDSSPNPFIEEPFQKPSVALQPGDKKVFLLSKAQFLSPPESLAQAQKLRFSYQLVELQNGKIFRLVKDFDEVSN